MRRKHQMVQADFGEGKKGEKLLER